MLISVENVTHIYNQDQGVKALDNINLNIDKNEFIGIVGATGSGKSTLVQLFNGLITPTKGSVYVENVNITDYNNKKDIRQKIGLVFQYPEHQLFEETIYEEIAFGPKNLKLDESEIKKRVLEALNLVEMNPDKFEDRSPFELSGGQQRRIAIAGVLAMKPKVLILDEPFAGLDPNGKNKLINLLTELNVDYNITIILISHHMSEIARLASRIIVMNEGKIVLNGSPEKIFTQVAKLKEFSLDLPMITEILFRLKDNGLNVRTDIFTVKEAAEEISAKLRGKV